MEKYFAGALPFALPKSRKDFRDLGVSSVALAIRFSKSVGVPVRKLSTLAEGASLHSLSPICSKHQFSLDLHRPRGGGGQKAKV